MLISETRKFIFIHIYKTAGISVMTSLLPYTSRYPFLPVVRHKLSYYFKSLQKYPLHTTAHDLIADIGEEAYSSFFSFSFVRNPWDWQVSLYNYMLSREDHFQHEFVNSFANFDEYVEWRCKNEVRFQKDFIYSDNDDLLVSFVGKFENLEKDFRKICEEIGVFPTLPRLNISNAEPYQSYYSKKSIGLIKETFRPDIETFDYEFE